MTLLRTTTSAALALLLAACGGATARDAAPAAATTVAPVGETVTDAAPTLQPMTLEVGGAAMVSLPTQAGRLDGETPIGVLSVQVTEPALARITARSTTIDTLMTVISPSGRRWVNDDSDGTNSMLMIPATELGEWTVEVRSFDPAVLGGFTARWTPQQAGVDVPTIAPETSASGQLRPGGSGFGGDTQEAIAWIDATAGQRLTLRVTSGDFDTTASLIGPDGVTWYNDDANDTGPDGDESPYDSTIDANVGVSGRYLLLVRPYGDSEGNFSVRLSVTEPVRIDPMTSLPSTPYAGPNTQGRMYGLFFGIETYSDWDVLPMCDDDATMLAQTFRDRGLMTGEQQTVLTDHKATQQAFVEAIDELEGVVTDEDLVFVFYSGHGGIWAVEEGDAADTTELDGTDETIVFHDQQMRDHDFVAQLDRLNAGTIILAMDSCQAGGFARDFVSQPGRIGIFSSDEDVLSSTAPQLGAGGFLSYVLRQAILQDADRHPGDGALTAGELTDAMVEGFVTHHRAMNMEGLSDPLQRLVFDRGSYNWNDVLWLYPRNADDDALVGLPECAPAQTVLSSPVLCE